MKKIIVIFGALLLCWAPRDVFAAGAQCNSIGGSCKSSSLCDIQKISNPDTTSQPSDCVDSQDPDTAGDVCCFVPKVVGSQCVSLGGRCQSESLCEITKQTIPGTTSSPSDCVDPYNEDTLGDTCCMQPEKYDCEVANQGHCAPSGGVGETDLGKHGCTGIESCWKIVTTAPAAPGNAAAGGGVGAPPNTLFAAIGSVNPATLTCIKTGNCTVDDIVYTGVGFAKFLMGLSGALFFIIFIYGGALYLTSFGEKGRVDKAKKAITGAAIGIIIVMGAWTIVRYLVGGITGIAVTSGPAAALAPGQTSTPNDCTTAFPGYTCKSYPNAKSKADLVVKCKAAGNTDCQQDHCSGQFDICAR